MFATLLKLALGSPAVLAAIVLTWAGTSLYHDFSKWRERAAVVRPWAKAVEERDQAVKFKDELIVAVSKDKERADVEISSLREELEKAENARRVAGATECVWSASDRRLLNSGTRPGAPR